MQQKFDRSQVGARMQQKLALLARRCRGANATGARFARKRGAPMQQKLASLGRGDNVTEARFARKGRGNVTETRFPR